MKLLKKIKNNKNSLVLLLVTTLFMSCTNYLDVDTDTDNPTVAPLSLLLTNIEVSINNVNNYNNYTASLLSVYTHQTTAREEQDQYGIRVDNINMSNDWNAIYLTLNDIETLIKQSTETGDLVYLGIGQMQKAYLMSIAVDLWGDVPYSEAGQLKSGIISPKFDDQKVIYTSIFELIKQAKKNIATGAGNQKPGKNDLFYEGDTAKWIKFANSFQLKLYNQVRLTSAFDQAGFNALIAENNFFTSLTDDFQFNQTKNLSPTDERNSYFLESYNSTQFGTYQSPWFYEILKGMNPNIHSGNPDPRLPYYFFNQLKDGQFPPDQGNTTTGNPNADYWDKSTGFFSIRFGSTGPDRDRSAESSYTYPGIFPAGGRYDDNKGGIMSADPKLATGIAPHRIFTYAEFLYVQAELMQVGKLSGDVTAKFQEALNASFAKVDQVVSKNGSAQTIPVLIGSTSVTTFTNKVIAEYTAASADKKLEIIMTQKWVATYGDPMDQYTDYRRTGFPILANPLSTTKEYQLDNGNGFLINDAQTVLNNPFQQSFFWPQDELNSNSKAPAQKNPGTYKIFWAK
ncbi:SusD-like starch-binding protein associating with outer membrane [Flavobacterium sp. 1]|uniref:SusD/RagB family nutrient-binding outer membrane lipoprotein n=1 Tax=Flavobacterium sp. 1 TaxID=2035200 RepID=UPI000C24D917|nr:SusD/RagB family nutrient-binding outer membrane lipoprotein [Flavobacterium sp. 1]PJJ10868.1 SusD-like starch-binding protein associating with outer membrane [Flavobacterium sp. 1]